MTFTVTINIMIVIAFVTVTIIVIGTIRRSHCGRLLTPFPERMPDADLGAAISPDDCRNLRKCT